MKRASKELINELTNYLKEGHSCEEIAKIMNGRGVLTPNGKTWNLWNVADYKSRHNLGKRARLSTIMKERHASGEMAQIKARTGKPSEYMAKSKEEKLHMVLSLGLSKESLIKVLSEVL